MKLIFIRHGQSTANLKQVIANRGFQYPLTETGIQQVHSLTHALAKFRVEAIYTSPLLRAVQTAEILQTQFRCPILMSPALREYDLGVFEGQSNKAAWMIYKIIKLAWLKGFHSVHPTEGESLLELIERFRPLIKTLKDRHPADGNLILVGHGGLYRHVLPVVAKNLNAKWCANHPLDNTQFVILNSSFPDQWICQTWGNHNF